MSDKTTIIISAGRGSESSRRALVQNLTGELAGWPDMVVTTLPHLYDLAPDGPGLSYLRSIPGDVVVVASLYPRAIHWLLDANGIEGRLGRTSFFTEEELAAEGADETHERTIWCLDIRPHNNSDRLLREIGRIAAESKEKPVPADVAAAGEMGEKMVAGEPTRVEEPAKHRWYPVVDFGRCGNCLECLNFCLFGVFGVDESGHLIVEQPDACRDGCPACSRVCPSQAIMFPQHNSPAIAGDHAAPSETYNPDLVQLLGAANPRDLAAAERALHTASAAGSAPEQPTTDQSSTDKPAANDELDDLVDDLDKMDL